MSPTPDGRRRGRSRRGEQSLDAEAARLAEVQAAEEAAAAGDTIGLARAALALAHEPWPSLVVADPEDSVLLARAAETLDTADGSPEAAELRLRVLSRLARDRETYPAEERVRLVTEALHRAHELGEPAALARVLIDRYWATWVPEGLDDRLSDAFEALQAAEESGDTGLALEARCALIVALVEAGNITGADAEAEIFEEDAASVGELAFTSWLTAYRAMRAALDGRFDRAMELARSGLDLGLEAGNPHAPLWFAAAWFNVGAQRGELGEVMATLESFLDRYAWVGAVAAGGAFAAASLGREADARREFQRLAAHDFAELPRDLSYIASLILLAETCWILGDRDRASTLHTLLSPFAGRNGVWGPAATTHGAVSRAVGLLETMLERFDDADRHFRSAESMNASMGAIAWEAFTQADHARMLLLRGGPEDQERAQRLLDRAERTARALGMAGLLQRVEEARSIPPSRRAARGLLTVLFTDIEGSTALRTQLGDAAAEELFAAHDRIVRAALQRHGARAVKSLGDGFMAAFSSARVALSCAIAIQEGIAEWPVGSAPLNVRVGLSAGEVSEQGSDIHGQAVNAAARVVAHASGTEILLADVVRQLAGATPEWTFRDRGLVSLKGFPEPWRLQQLLWQEGVGAPASAAATPGRFVREGEYWTIAYENASMRLKDSKGLHYLAALLRTPHREHHALELVAAVRGDIAPSHPGVPGRTQELSGTGLGDAGEVLDSEAKRAYRERLADLDSELEEARSWGDTGRIEQLEGEREALVKELSAAVGLGGRDRRAASVEDRARVAVTKAIRSAIDRIARESADLGIHLREAVRTGIYCRYAPDPERAPAWRWGS